MIEGGTLSDFHLGTSFLALRRPVLEDERFRRLLESARPERFRATLTRKDEVGLTRFLIGRGHAFSTLVPGLYPYHPLLTGWAFTLLDQGLPLVKRSLITDNPFHLPGMREWRTRLSAAAPEPSGRIIVPGPLPVHEFVELDEQIGKKADRWVFVGDPVTHHLDDDLRLLLESVRSFPKLTTVVLTRSRPTEATGRHLVTPPVDSPEGQRHLLEAGAVFLPASAEDAVGVPLTERRRAVIVVPTASQGLPIHDALVAEATSLPESIRTQEERVRAGADGRRLVLLLATGRTPYRFSADEVARMRSWTEAPDAVLGIRAADALDLSPAVSRRCSPCCAPPTS